jgi:uncharacterized YigZ family protein
VDAAQPARALTPEGGGVRYRVPAARHTAELTIERSRFLCTIERAASPEAAQSFVRELQRANAGATHNCWAFVAGPPGSTSHIGLSDDGEPHGTAGRPMLTVLLHADVGEVAAVVTRWYGGVKLGTGGLARAYGGAVQQALATLPTVLRVDRVTLEFAVDYAVVTPVRQLLEQLEAEVQHEAYAEAVTYCVAVARDRVDDLRRVLADLTRGRAEVRVGTTDGQD